MMSSVRRSAVATSLAIASVLLMGSRSAVSQEPIRESNDALTSLEQRLHSLQDELVRLQDELRRVEDELGRARSAASHAKSAPEPVRVSSGSMPPVVTPTPAPASVAPAVPAERVASDEPSCTPPFTVDSAGIKRFRPECLALHDCDTPFIVDAGIKRFRPECLGQTAVAGGEPANACTPPYEISTDGIKHIKRDCM